MKKRIAIILSCVMVLSLCFTNGSAVFAAENKMGSVNVQSPDDIVDEGCIHYFEIKKDKDELKKNDRVICECNVCGEQIYGVIEEIGICGDDAKYVIVYNPDPNSLYNKDLYVIGSGRTYRFCDNDGKYFYYDYKVDNAYFGEGITGIGRGTLTDGECGVYRCNIYGRIKLPSTLTEIDDYVFEWLHMEYVEMDDAVTYIGEGAFSNCDSLRQVNIPNSLTRLENRVFAYCPQLEKVIISDSITSIGDSVFYNYHNSEIQFVYVPSSVTEIGRYAFDSVLCIIVEKNSYAYRYAKKYNVPYKVCNQPVISCDDKENTAFVGTNNESYRFEVETFLKTGEISTDATWSISGQKSKNTKISEDGLLTIARDEIADHIYVTAKCDDSSASVVMFVKNDTIKATFEGDINEVFTCDSEGYIDRPTSYEKEKNDYIYSMNGEQIKDEEWPIQIESDVVISVEKKPYYYISYELNGGVNDDRNPSVAYKEESIDLYPASKEGYEFDGWYVDERCTKEIGDEVTRDTTVYAKWSHAIHEYQIEGYQWNRDYSECKMIMLCTEEPSKPHGISVDAQSVDKEVVLEPTCSSKGVTKISANFVYKDEEYTESFELYNLAIDPNKHDYQEVVKKATLSEDGLVSTVCSRCGNVENETVVSYPKTIKLSASSYTYDGNTHKPTVSVVGSDGKEITSTNYTVTYPSGLKNVGKYSVKITFKGNYSGTKTLTYVINPPKTALTSLSAGSKSFTAKWTKKSTQVTGYQIQYSTSSSFASGNKTVTISSYSTVSKAIKSLTAKKTYYVRIRTYKTVSGVKYYSAWSAKKSVTTKK